MHFGRNYHPEDIEWAALRVSGVLPGSCVAFSDPSGEEGAVIVAVESDGDDDIRARVRVAIANAIGLTPRDVLIVDTGAIPKAANGKIQRLAAREAYARGELMRRVATGGPVRGRATVRANNESVFPQRGGVRRRFLRRSPPRGEVPD